MPPHDFKPFVTQDFFDTSHIDRVIKFGIRQDLNVTDQLLGDLDVLSRHNNVHWPHHT